MKKIYLLTLISIVILSGCNKWLDIQPSDRITEDVVFSTPQGFKAALNGIYIELNKSSLYGKQLSYGFTDILAQHYAIDSENKDLYPVVSTNNYKHGKIEQPIEEIWTTAYKLIANINKIILKTDENRAVLSDHYYALIKGEALALRAMIHFDVLRLFGPLPSKPLNFAIPYYTEFKFQGNPLETSNAITIKILNDYAEAAKLLKDYDPIVKSGLSNINKDDFFNFRNLRLNYYAVKALTARVCMYASADVGNEDYYKELAVACADEVINEQGRLFPFVAEGMVIPSDNPDRVCSTEIIFATQNQNINNIYTYNFSDVVNSQTGFYASNKSILGENGSIALFSTDDYRYKSWFSTQREIRGKLYRVIGKYKVGENLDLIKNQVMSIIRISELYYIKAECERSVKTLNVIRNTRGLEKLSRYNDYNLENEYRREFYCEGQLFFYYKRLNKSSIKTGYGIDHPMSGGSYVIPIPEKENN